MVLYSSYFLDGINSPRSRSVTGGPLPPPRLVSRRALDLSRDQDEDRSATIFSMVWGQFIDHDVTATEENTDLTCCENGRLINEDNPECIAIRLKRTDPLSKNGQIECFHMVRNVAERRSSCGSERMIINEVSSWLDGSAVYGSNLRRQKLLRTFSRGLLRVNDTKSSLQGEMLPTDNGEETVACLSTQTCFLAGMSLNLFIYSLNGRSYLMGPLSLRLCGVVGAKNYMMSTF